VSDYIVSRVEDVVTAIAGQGNISEWALNVITRDGFVSMRPIPGMPTIGDLLSSELRDELGGDAVTRKMLDALTDRSGQLDLDAWLIDNFFKAHLQRSNRVPFVWHLSSREGEIQVLVAASRLDAGRLARINHELVGLARGQLQRQLTEAYRKDRQGEVETIEARLADIGDFEASLNMLLTGSGDSFEQGSARGGAMRWAPMSGEGLISNLAPFQRLGLLPIPVLSEEEIDLHLEVS
jgi:hypothetical protein